MKRMSILSALVLLGVGCDAVLGIEAGVAAPPKPQCETNEDCVKALHTDPDCALLVCEDGSCRGNYAIDGAGVPPARQTPNDCQRLVCDGHGGLKQEALDDADDGNPCTEEHCKDGVVLPPKKLNGTALACYTGPEGTRGVGSCHEGTIGCNDGAATGECAGQVLPKTEVCLDGADDDCDGNPDEAYDGCICGDGKVTPEMGEQCDDGGQADGDDCSPACKEQRVLQIDGASAHFCALLSGGVMKCWGRDGLGELGIPGSYANIGDEVGEMGGGLHPIDFGGRKVASINADEASSCAVFEDGGAKCWGAQRHGSLGQPGLSQDWTESPKNLPDIALGGPVKHIAGTLDHKCALLKDGTVKCWGINAFGALGLADGNPNAHPVPTKAIDFGGQAVEQIATGAYHTCARLTGGQVKCWGYNNAGQLGRDNTAAYGLGMGQMGNDLAPIPLGEPTRWIAAGGFTSCAILQSGAVKCWGNNTCGQLGLSDSDNRGDNSGEMAALEEVDLGLPGGVTVEEVAVADLRTCALLSSGDIKCWGAEMLSYNCTPQSQGGQNIGDGPGEMGTWLSSIQLGSAQKAIGIGLNAYSVCALLESGNLACGGRNDCGILGQEKAMAQFSFSDSALPVRLFSNLW